MEFKHHFGLKLLRKEWTDHKLPIILLPIVFVIFLFFRISHPEQFAFGTFWIIFYLSLAGTTGLFISLLYAYLSPFLSKKVYMDYALPLEKRYRFYLDTWKWYVPYIETYREIPEKFIESLHKKKEEGSWNNRVAATHALSAKGEMEIQNWKLCSILFQFYGLYQKNEIDEQTYVNKKVDYFNEVYNNVEDEPKLIVLYMYFIISEKLRKLQKTL